MSDASEIFVNTVVLPTNWKIMEERISHEGFNYLDQRYKIIEEIVEFHQAMKAHEMTEISDSLRSERFKAVAFELADIVISICTFLSILGIKYVSNHFLGQTDFPMSWIRQVSEGYPQYVLWNAFDLAKDKGINLEETILEKLEYNKTRTDWPKTGVRK